MQSFAIRAARANPAREGHHRQDLPVPLPRDADQRLAAGAPDHRVRPRQREASHLDCVDDAARSWMLDPYSSGISFEG